MKYCEWAKETSVNAVSLAEESDILFRAKKFERAYYLAHMAVEESSKAILLYVMSISATPESELPKVTNLLKNHKKKIEFVIELVKTLNEDLAERLDGIEASYCNYINDLKNGSMYVSVVAEIIVSPKDIAKGLDIERYLSMAAAMANYSKKLTKQL